MRTMSKQLIEHERIRTSQAKAKAVKPEVEKMITLAKRGDLHARRLLLAKLGQDKFTSTSWSRRSPRATASGPAATPGSSSSARGASDSTEMVFLELV